jgi:hypothetical protein
MSSEKVHNYFTVLTFIFLFESVSQSLLYPLGPFIVAQDNYIKQNISSQEVTAEEKNH